MNLVQLQEEIGRLLNDPQNSRWSKDVLTTRINEAQTIIMGYTDALKVEEPLTPTANTQAVPLNSRVMDIMRVVVTRPNGDQIPIDGTTEYDLDFDYPNWMNLGSGEPTTWFYKAADQTLNLVPAPDSNNIVTNGLIVTEVRSPSAVSAPTDIPFDSNAQLVPYHYAIISYVVARCYADDSTAEALSKSKFFRSGSMNKPGEFENEIMRINSEFDNPKVPANIKWRPQGGRISSWMPSKANPLGTW